ncbi:hypothetical protein IKF34_00660 [Candidatus Saccharibacteria bacterium]|nr:hypothetical protein [Candidatus Saccharibacteria bacterium]
MKKVKYSDRIDLNGVKPWPHEKKMAEALADAGYMVKFKRKSERYKTSTADAYLNGILWEFKSPTGKILSAVERNLRRCKGQSPRIVFDARRMKKMPDQAIMREILAKAPYVTEVEKIIYINKHGKCIDIYNK